MHGAGRCRSSRRWLPRPGKTGCWWCMCAGYSGPTARVQTRCNAVRMMRSLRQRTQPIARHCRPPAWRTGRGHGRLPHPAAHPPGTHPGIGRHQCPTASRLPRRGAFLACPGSDPRRGLPLPAGGRRLPLPAAEAMADGPAHADGSGRCRHHGRRQCRSPCHPALDERGLDMNPKPPHPFAMPRASHRLVSRSALACARQGHAERPDWFTEQPRNHPEPDIGCCATPSRLSSGGWPDSPSRSPVRLRPGLPAGPADAAARPDRRSYPGSDRHRP